MKVFSDVPQDHYLLQKDKVAINESLMKSGLNEIYKQINTLHQILKTTFEMHYVGYKYQELQILCKNLWEQLKVESIFPEKSSPVKLVGINAKTRMT